MIVVGNSNVNTFKQQGLVTLAGAEQVSVVWVGALTAPDFYNGHPAGHKVQQLFEEHRDEWKFLSLGIHDIYDLCGAASKFQLNNVLRVLQQLYQQLFTELSRFGRFGWLVFPQPAHELTFPGVSPEEVLEIARTFNSHMKQWCGEAGVAVIDPADRILGPDGKPLPHLLQKDGIHLNVQAARCYLDDIAALTGVPLEFQSDAPPFEPANEPESFVSLLLNALDMPHRRQGGLAGLEGRLLDFVAELLRGKGLELDIDADTELVDSGLLDSLNLVETYTFAVNSIGMEIVYDVDLRTLDTAGKICRFLEEQAQGGPEPEGPTFEDFITSMRGDLADPAQREAILAADARIAALPQARVQEFIRHFEVVSYSFNCNYGIIYFWLSFFAAQNRNYATALELLKHGSTADLAYPVRGEHVRYYRERWEKLQEMAQGPAPRPAAQSRPRLSVVIPSYNYGHYLKDCLESILSQGYPNLELIILDGGSTDDTVEVIRRYEKHIAYWRSHKDAGQYAAIEEGLNRASGEIMTWLNADDMFHPGAFDAAGRIFAECAEVEWLMGRPNSFDEQGRQKHVLSYLPLNSRAKYLADEEFIQQEGVFWRRTLWQRSGACIDRTLPLAADLELWARFFRSARLFSVDMMLAGFRDHPLQKSKDKAGYTAEADRVLARERELFAAEKTPFNPPAPLPILIQGDRVIL
ncbi:glycosyltransferase [Geomonas paludis]|uniref:Glycosyltransferase n=1 Tax=Geomonas paludis TaxID=2740185 RepID=A0A6V8N1X0_9BACT|nr:glycosyltransferase [Geomonas paludis]UPU36484.1 glycosyltransferase [Geomonas paludis]GFO65339.1 hypothetical protein GMPD_32580 [Geomonas paludis]